MWKGPLAERKRQKQTKGGRTVGTLAPAGCWLLFSCVGVAWLVCVACTHHPSQESADGQYTHDSVPRKYNKEDVRREDA